MNSVSHSPDLAFSNGEKLVKPLDHQILFNSLIPFQIYFPKSGGFTPLTLSYWYCVSCGKNRKWYRDAERQFAADRLPEQAKSFRSDILAGISGSDACFHRFTSKIHGWQAGYPLRKSFRRDILDGYLQNSSFVFMELARKCNSSDMNW
jgi:hypothetical protein